MSFVQNSNSNLYNWYIKHYEVQAIYCWSIKEIPWQKVCNFFSVSLILKMFEKKVGYYPTLVLTSTNCSNLPSLYYKERYYPIMHVNKVSKNVGEKGHLQILVESFIGQEYHWWGTNQSQLQTWTTTSTYFIEIFGG